MAARQDPADGGTSASSHVDLEQILMRLVGESRAFLLQVESYLDELRVLGDERAQQVEEAARRALADPPGPGTARHLEQSANELLRRLRGHNS